MKDLGKRILPVIEEMKSPPGDSRNDDEAELREVAPSHCDLTIKRVKPFEVLP